MAEEGWRLYAFNAQEDSSGDVTRNVARFALHDAVAWATGCGFDSILLTRLDEPVGARVEHFWHGTPAP